MAKQIKISDEVYALLQTKKGDSFTDKISNLLSPSAIETTDDQPNNPDKQPIQEDALQDVYITLTDVTNKLGLLETALKGTNKLIQTKQEETECYIKEMMKANGLK